MNETKPEIEVIEPEVVEPKKPGRPPLLTEQREALILAAIRSGAYAWVAAQAAGISAPTFHRWMADDRPEYLAFREKVNEARAQARMRAEMAVAKEKPELWLMKGPGRERPGSEAGWADDRAKLAVGVKVGVGPGGVAVEAQAWDFSKMSNEELDQLERLARKALPASATTVDPGGEGSTES